MTENQEEKEIKEKEIKTIEEEPKLVAKWDKLFQCGTFLVLLILLILFILYVIFAFCFTWELLRAMKEPEGWLITEDENLSLQIRIAQGITAGVLGYISFTIGRIYLRILGLARRGKIESPRKRVEPIKETPQSLLDKMRRQI